MTGETPMGFDIRETLTPGFTRSTESNLADESKEEEELWTCGTCTFGNDMVLEQC